MRTGDGGRTYADLTAAVSDGDSGTYGHLDSLGAAADGAWLLVGGKAPFAALAVEMNVAANGNGREDGKAAGHEHVGADGDRTVGPSI